MSEFREHLRLGEQADGLTGRHDDGYGCSLFAHSLQSNPERKLGVELGSSVHDGSDRDQLGFRPTLPDTSNSSRPASEGVLFNGIVWQVYGAERGLEFLTGYMIEKSLSVDNIFVFVVIFGALGIPALYQHRVLFWGILTALVLRAVMIFAGTALLARFHWLIYVFGAFLVLTGVKLFIQRQHASNPADSAVMKLARRLIPATERLDGEKFFTVEQGKRVATPLFMALLLVEATDVVFAVDSIPAIFAVTNDPFIVFTSNIFAILGLRSLFFLLAGVVDKFRYLKTGLAAVLVFVGAKMSLVDLYKVPPLVSLLVIATLLSVAVAASLWVSRKESLRSESSTKESPRPATS